MNDGTIDLGTDPLRHRLFGTTYHGNHDFDIPYMTLIDGEQDGQGLYPLWQGGCAQGLVLPTNINHLVSLYVWEKYTIRHALGSELYVTMRDASDQGMDQVNALGEWVNLCRRTGPVLVHCQAGLNRSSLVVAKALWLSGFGTGNQIIKHIRSTRSAACLCNETFEAEVKSWTRRRKV